MGSPLTLAQVIDRLMPEMHALLWEEMEGYQDDPDYNWVGKVFRTAPTSRWENEFSSQQRIKDWPMVSELEPMPIYEWDQPTDLVFELRSYGLGFKVSERWLRYGGDPYVHIMAKYQEFLSDFMQGGLRAHNKRAGEILLDAFDGNILVGSDGQPLCDDSHTHAGGVATYDNKLLKKLTASGALDDAFALSGALELADQHGNPMSINLDTLVISEQYKKAAFELLNNTYKPGATNDELNYYNGVIKNVVVCPWFKNSVKSGSQHYWFLLDSRKHSLKGLIGSIPHLLPQTNADNRSVEIDGLTEFEYLWRTWEGVVGSDGTA